MFETPYYNQSIRKLVVAFGAMFSKVQVQRLLNDGSVGQIVAVPIAYGPKEKIFVKLRQDPKQTNHVYTILPRMGFEIVGYNYAADRKMNKMNQIRCYKDGGVTAVFSPTPYDLNIQLHILTKGAEDGFAIIEQILPIFNPEYIFTIDALDGMNIKQDVPVVLNSVSVMDDYEGDFNIRRLVTHTLDFTAKMQIYGPVKEPGVILKTETTIPNMTEHISEGNLETGEITRDEWLEFNE